MGNGKRRPIASASMKGLTVRCHMSTVALGFESKLHVELSCIVAAIAGVRAIGWLCRIRRKGNLRMTDVVRIDSVETGTRKHGAGMLFRAMLAQNVGTGCAFGGLGVSVLALQDRFDASLGTATMGLSFTVLFMTALGPLIAGLIARWGLRVVMSTGVSASLIGYVALAYAPNMPFALAACALLIGPGAALFAALPPAVLAGGWYPHARGRAMGIAYLPLCVTFIPLVGVGIIQRYGLTSFYLSLATLHLFLLPLMFGVIEAPTEVVDEQRLIQGGASGLAHNVVLGGAIFWLIALGDGIFNGAAIVGSTHILPIVDEYGASMETGAWLLSVSGAASILGSLLAGYACDRVGSAKTLALAGLGFATAWLIIAVTGWLPALMVSAILIGLCGAAVFPPVSALIVQVFGAQALPKVLGLLGIVTIPFTFAMSPVAGWLRDISGSYEPVFAGLITTCVIAAATFLGISRYLARRPGASSILSGAALSPPNPV